MTQATDTHALPPSHQRHGADPARHRDGEQARPAHFTGAADATVVLLEYGEYECHFCSDAEALRLHLGDVFGQRLKFVFRHFPLYAIHPHAELAAEAAEAAGAQDMFWPMHHLLMTGHQQLTPADLDGYAQSLRLDMGRFRREMNARVYRSRVTQDQQEGVRAGVHGTPTYFLDGAWLDGSQGMLRIEIEVGAALGND